MYSYILSIFIMKYSIYEIFEAVKKKLSVFCQQSMLKSLKLTILIWKI